MFLRLPKHSKQSHREFRRDEAPKKHAASTHRNPAFGQILAGVSGVALLAYSCKPCGMRPPLASQYRMRSELREGMSDPRKGKKGGQGGAVLYTCSSANEASLLRLE